MTEERFKDLEIRMRKVEDFILSQLNTLLELSQSLKNRVEVLEEHDVEFMAMVHSTCDIKNKEIATAKEESIRISVDHTNKTHQQTWYVVGAMFTMFISAVVYFNTVNENQSLDIKKHDTQIENMNHVLDKIDGKLDSLADKIGAKK